MQQHNNGNVPHWLKDSVVTDCATVEEFCDKYYKNERFTAHGVDYTATVINTHKKDLENKGYTLISQHGSVTGKLLAYLND